MIINHNLPGMNAIRNMNTNSANASSSMQKLSSGLRINKAGDDAAGLAISEKMRGQIRGLDQASSNAQDGISMIQTGEGGLSETQSILQRMRELAVQSSNDTNTGDDRTVIQTEMNQLSSEVNRIGNTTEFNTQKLLNGGTGTAHTGNLTVATTATYAVTGKVGTDTLDMTGGAATGAVSNLATMTSSVKAGTIDIGNLQTVTASKLAGTAGTIGSPLTQMTASTKAGTADINKAVSTAGVNAAGTKTVAGDVTVNAATAGTKADLTIDFTNALTGLTSGQESSISIGGKEYSFTAGANQAASAANLLTALKADAEDNGGAMVGVNAADITLAGSSITFTSKAINTDIKIGTVDTTTDNAAAVAGKVLDGGKAAVYTYELKTNFTAGDSIKIGGQTFTAGTDFAVGADTAATTTNLLTKLQGTAAITGSYSVTAGSPSWTGDANSITITAKTAGVDATAAAYSTGVTVNQTAAVQGQYKFEIASNFEAGQKVTIAGQDFTATETGKGSGALGAMGAGQFEIGADINTTATNLLKAINADTTLSGKFDAANLSTGKDGANNAVAGVTATNLATDADTIVLKEKTASGDTMANVVGANITVTNQAAVQGKYSFDVNKNFSAGDSVNIGGKTYTARETGKGSGAAGAMLANEFQVGADTSTSIDNLKNVINADGSSKYTAAKADSTFFSNNRVVLTEKTASGTDLSSVTGGNVSDVAGVSSFKITNNLADGDVIKIAGKMLLAGGANASAGLTGDFAVGATAKDTATNIRIAINGATTSSSQALQDLKAKYTVTDDGAGTLTFTENKASGTDLANTVDLSIAKNTDNRADGAAVKQSYDITTQALNAGSKVTIGGVDITLAKNGTAAGVAAELAAQINDATNTTTTSLNAKYTATANGDKLTLTQKTAAAETAIGANFATTDHNGFTANLQIGANTDQTLTIGISDMRSAALKVTGDGSSNTVAAKNGSVASYVSQASVTDGTSNTNTEFALDISTNAKATAAVSVLDDAISAVSTQRAQLGAYQNRLEHTIANLGTSSENLTTAESRIRDVDMAKEMANFSKNNILAQAAQSMLAQANQQPQQVLQLLR